MAYEVMRDVALTSDQRALAESCYGLVYSLAGRAAAGAESRRDELIGPGMEGLIRAAQDFDPSRGIKFVTYAYHWIYRMIHCQALGAPATTCDPHVLDGLRVARRCDAIDDPSPRLLRALEGLGERRREAVRMLVMEGREIDELAEKYGITRQAVCHLKHQGLRAIRRRLEPYRDTLGVA